MPLLCVVGCYGDWWLQWSWTFRVRPLLSAGDPHADAEHPVSTQQECNSEINRPDWNVNANILPRTFVPARVSAPFSPPHRQHTKHPLRSMDLSSSVVGGGSGGDDALDALVRDLSARVNATNGTGNEREREIDTPPSHLPCHHTCKQHASTHVCCLPFQSLSPPPLFPHLYGDPECVEACTFTGRRANT